jgi:hypothetical protein
MTTSKHTFLGAACLLAVAACGGNNEDNGGGATNNATFTEVYTQIIGPSCTGCHAGSDPTGNLNMSTQSLAYQNLAGVAASGPSCGGADPVPTRVVAYDYAGSLLWQKVAGEQKCGSRMPLGGPYLSSTQIQLIAEWIDDGAQND